MKALIVIVLFALTACGGAAIEQQQQIVQEAPPNVLQLGNNDISFHAMIVDGAGTRFLALPNADGIVQICKLVSAVVECFYTLPGTKHSSVDMAVLENGSIAVSFGARLSGTTGPFLPYYLEIPSVATPYPIFRSRMPIVKQGDR